jgi:hypothetical protein
VVPCRTIYVAFTNHPLLGQYDLSSIMICASGGARSGGAKQFEARPGHSFAKATD